MKVFWILSTLPFAVTEASDTLLPSEEPAEALTKPPTRYPTKRPTRHLLIRELPPFPWCRHCPRAPIAPPSLVPTKAPIAPPSLVPTKAPIAPPSLVPTTASTEPSANPNDAPSDLPSTSTAPSTAPSDVPKAMKSDPTKKTGTKEGKGAEEDKSSSDDADNVSGSPDDCSCEITCEDPDWKWLEVQGKSCNGEPCACDIDVDKDFGETECDPATGQRTPLPRSFKNCMYFEIEKAAPINIGNLDNVKIKRITAKGGTKVAKKGQNGEVEKDENGDPIFEMKGHDVDIEGQIKRSLICEIESKSGDIEFGGSHCPATVLKSAFREVKAGKDLKFEEGTRLLENAFGKVSARKLELTDEPKEVEQGQPQPVDFDGSSYVFDNTIESLEVEECKDQKKSQPIPGKPRKNLSTRFAGNEITKASGKRKKDCDEEPFVSGFPGLI